MDPKPLFDYIERFIQLTEEEKLILLEECKIRNYLKGQYVVQQGDVCQYESFVLSGCLKTSHIDRNGNEHVVMFAIKNWWTADLGSFVSQQPADYNVQCLEPSVLFQFSYDKLGLLYQKIPKLERFFRIIIQNAYVAAQKRIVNSYSLSAKDRYIRFCDQYPDIEQRVPQYLIASYLGITKEFLSKVRNEMASGG